MELSLNWAMENHSPSRYQKTNPCSEIHRPPHLLSHFLARFTLHSVLKMGHP